MILALLAHALAGKYQREEMEERSKGKSKGSTVESCDGHLSCNRNLRALETEITRRLT